jgi:cytochrome c biogenesis protein CcdA
LIFAVIAEIDLTVLGILAATAGSLVWSVLLLLLYFIGHGILAVIAEPSMGFAQKLSQSEKYGKASAILKIVMGAVILLIGFYLLYSGF